MLQTGRSSNFWKFSFCFNKIRWYCSVIEFAMVNLNLKSVFEMERCIAEILGITNQFLRKFWFRVRGLKNSAKFKVKLTRTKNNSTFRFFVKSFLKSQRLSLIRTQNHSEFVKSYQELFNFKKIWLSYPCDKNSASYRNI